MKQNRTRNGLTSTAQCTTDTPFLNKLKERKTRREAQKVGMNKKISKQKLYQKKGKLVEKVKPGRRVWNGNKRAARWTLFHQYDKQSSASASTINEQEDEYFCGICRVHGNDDDVWIECEACLSWYHTTCVNVDKLSIPDEFTCDECHN